MSAPVSAFAAKAVALFESRPWHAGAFAVQAGMAAVMASCWVLQPRDGFFLILGGLFAGWALESLLKLARPDGNHLGTALLSGLLPVVACTYLYGRDGHWGYGAVTALGLVLLVGAAVVTALVGKPRSE